MMMKYFNKKIWKNTKIVIKFFYLYIFIILNIINNIIKNKRYIAYKSEKRISDIIPS